MFHKYFINSLLTTKLTKFCIIKTGLQSICDDLQWVSLCKLSVTTKILGDILQRSLHYTALPLVYIFSYCVTHSENILHRTCQRYIIFLVAISCKQTDIVKETQPSIWITLTILQLLYNTSSKISFRLTKDPMFTAPTLFRKSISQGLPQTPRSVRLNFLIWGILNEVQRPKRQCVLQIGFGDIVKLE